MVHSDAGIRLVVLDDDEEEHRDLVGRKVVNGKVESHIKSFRATEVAGQANLPLLIFSPPKIIEPLLLHLGSSKESKRSG